MLQGSRSHDYNQLINEADEHEEEEHHEHNPKGWKFCFLMLQSLGVIFPEIATSQLLVQFFEHGEKAPKDYEVIGMFSIVIWALILQATIKYIVCLLSVTNHGEGGTFSLCALLLQKKSKLHDKGKYFVRIVSILGACLIIGQGAITPAVKISRAVSMMNDFLPSGHKLGRDDHEIRLVILTITFVLVAIIFQLNRFGASRFGKFVGPICALWLIGLAGLSIWHIVEAPKVLLAFSPHTAFLFLKHQFEHGGVKHLLEPIGRCFIVIGGMEILYADMGHFGSRPIRFCWFFIVLPSLVLSYLGVGAIILNHPAPDSHYFPLKYMIPRQHAPFFFPGLAAALVMLLAASQTGGVFSTISQACSLNFFPPVYTVRTDEHAEGQTYLPHMNQFIMLISLSIVTGFHSTGENNNIVEVYGIALAILMTTTTILYILTLKYYYDYPFWKLIPGFIFLSWDIVFVAGTAMDVEPQGWPALTVALFFGFMMFSWTKFSKVLKACDKGAQSVFLKEEEDKHHSLLNSSSAHGERYLKESEDDGRREAELRIESAFIADFDLTTVARGSEGMGVFVSTSESHEGVPEVFSSVMKYTRWVPKMIVFLRIHHLKKPRADNHERIFIQRHELGIYTVNVRIGFFEPRCVLTKVIKLAHKHGLPGSSMRKTYYIHREIVKISGFHLGWWLSAKMFSFMKGIFSETYSTFKVGGTDIVEVGVFRQIQLSKPKEERTSLSSINWS